MTDAKYQDSSAIEALELVDDIELELQAVPVDYSVGDYSHDHIHRTVLLNTMDLFEDMDYPILRNLN